MLTEIKPAMKASMHAFRSSNVRGLGVVGVLFVLYILWAGIPASLWIDVGSVTVADAIEGEAPKLVVDRTVKRSFAGLRQVELEKKGTRGFVQIDKAVGGDNYRPDNELPEDLDMDWWTAPKQFRPLPGRYRIETCWTVILTWIKDRRTCVVSNTYTVRPRQ